MPERLRSTLRLVIGALLVLGLNVVHVEMSDPLSGSVLLVSVRSSAGSVQVCRSLDPEETAALPRHMRRTEICELVSVPYRLEVDVDGSRVFEKIYEAPGLHKDRPIAVDQRLGVEPGTRSVTVRFAPADSPAESLADVDIDVFETSRDIEFAEGRIRGLKLSKEKGGFELY